MLNFFLSNAQNNFAKIHAIHLEPSSFDLETFYVFVDAHVNWGFGEDRDLKRVYTMLVQYSSVLGLHIDLQQPAHIPEQDALEISGKFHLFVRERTEHNLK